MSRQPGWSSGLAGEHHAVAGAVPRGCPPGGGQQSGTVGRQNVQPRADGGADLTTVSPSASRPRSKISAASSAPSTVDSALGDNGSTAMVDDAVVGKQPVAIAERGRRGGIDRHADRRRAHRGHHATTAQGGCHRGERGVTPQRGRAAPSARLRTVEKPTPQPSALSRPCFCRRGIRLHPTVRTAGGTSDAIGIPAPTRPAQVAAHQASQARRTGEDLAPDRVVPVAEAGPQDVRLTAQEPPRKTCSRQPTALRRTARCTAGRSSG